MKLPYSYSLPKPIDKRPIDESNNLYDYYNNASTNKIKSRIKQIQQLIEVRYQQAITSKQQTNKHYNFARKRTPNIKYY